MQATKSILGIIGGSGIYNLQGFDLVEKFEVKTPFGDPSGPISLIKIENAHFYFIPRHGEGHFISPSEINYRANIFALKKIGVSHVVSISAVGSLKEEHAPTKFVLPDQFIDWTKGKRERSFFSEGMVGHVSCANPVDLGLQKEIAKYCQKAELNYSVGGSYICIEGPQFSTRAESNIYRSFGADVIGMTNVPEAFLAKEAGLAYATIAMITDYDCWKDEHCTLEEIMNVMKINYISAQKLLKHLVPGVVQNPSKFVPENLSAVVTNSSLIKGKNQEILEVLLGSSKHR